MDNTYGEFQGTELDPSLDFDWDEEEEGNDLLPILGLAALVAAFAGGALVLFGRRRQPTATEQAQMAAADASEKGKETLKAAQKALAEAQLGDRLDEAIKSARKAASNGHVQKGVKAARSKAEDVLDTKQLRSMLKDAQDKAQEAAGRLDLDEAAKGAAATVAGAALVKYLQEAMQKAGEAAKKVNLPDSGTASDLADRVSKAVGDVKIGDVDTETAGEFLDDLKERILEAIEQVRTEIAPKAMHTLRTKAVPAVQDTAEKVATRVQEDVLPAAQERVGQLRDEVLPAAQEQASRFAEEELAPRAKQAVSAAQSFSGMLRELALVIIAKVVDELFPEAKKATEQLLQTAREEVIPAAAETAGRAGKKMQKDVLPKAGAVASQTPGMLTDLLQMASDKAGAAFDKAQPKVSDAAEAASKAADKAAKKAKKSAREMTSSRGGGVSGAVGGAVDATAHATREFAGVLFWLSMLGGLVLLVFVPEREKQEEIWENARQFLGEVREMWRDLQGPDYEIDDVTETPS